MAQKYRSRTDIVYQIIQATNGIGVTKTRIMYMAFLSYAQLKEYLAVMVENNLIEYEAITKTYKATEKGLRFARLADKVSEIVAPAELK